MDKSSSSLVEHFLCGGMGGTWTVLVGHPFDTVKVRLQTMPIPKPGEKPMYRGMLDCFRATVVNEGITGLYKGMLVPLLTITPVFAVSFMSYRLGKQIFGQNDPNMSNQRKFCAGAFAGVVTTTLMAPVERVKCMLQIQKERAKADRQFRGPIHLISAELAEGGLTRIYKGYFATILREFPGSGIYFLTYELFTAYETVGASATILKMIIGGGMAGVVMWLVVLPMDTLKSRLQTAPAGVYTGLGHVFTDLMANEGPMALYKGAVPVMARAFPANAACFLGFEFCNRQIIQRFKNRSI